MRSSWAGTGGGDRFGAVGGFNQAGFVEEAGGFLGGSRIDVEAGAPLEAGHLRQLGHHLEVPVVVVLGVRMEG